MDKKPSNFFNQEHAEKYDEKNKKLSPIGDSLHFLMSLILTDLPNDAKILSVGAGTGAEIIYLAKKFKNWSFVAVDPSESMLNVCKERVQQAKMRNQIQYIHGFAHDVITGSEFDAVIAALVGHFVPNVQKDLFYRSLVDHLKINGILINAEISVDLGAANFPTLLKSWEKVQQIAGATAESLAELPKQLREVLSITSPSNVEKHLVQAGIVTPIQFYQALMIRGWFGVKSPTS